MSHNLTSYLELKHEAARRFAARDYREAQIAANVAGQFYRGLSLPERRKAESTLGSKPE